MVLPLTKRDKHGALYERPALVEATIANALGLDGQTLKARLRIVDRKSSDYLQSESLVHLIRQAMRDRDGARANMVIAVLLNRCEAILKVKIRDADFANAGDLREEVLGEFSEMFALDGAGGANELDYFECRFQRAFKTFRIDLVRSEMTRRGRIATLPAEFEDEEDDEAGAEAVFAKLSEAFRTAATQQGTMELQDLHAAIRALPDDERRAVTLVHLMGYKEESHDPDEPTAATLCGCSGRTIRNRLARAAAKLKPFKEDL